MKHNNLIGNLRQKRSELENSEVNKWEEKVVNELNCDELLFIEIKRDVRGDSNKIIGQAIKMKGCKKI